MLYELILGFILLRSVWSWTSESYLATFPTWFQIVRSHRSQSCGHISLQIMCVQTGYCRSWDYKPYVSAWVASYWFDLLARFVTLVGWFLPWSDLSLALRLEFMAPRWLNGANVWYLELQRATGMFPPKSKSDGSTRTSGSAVYLSRKINAVQRHYYVTKIAQVISITLFNWIEIICWQFIKAGYNVPRSRASFHDITWPMWKWWVYCVNLSWECFCLLFLNWLHMQTV